MFMYALLQAEPRHGEVLPPTKSETFNLSSGSFMKDHLLFPLFTKSDDPQKVPPWGIASPCRGPGYRHHIFIKHFDYVFVRKML